MKRLVHLFLLLIMVLSLVAGCGMEEGAETPTEAIAPTMGMEPATTQAAIEPTPMEMEPTAPAADTMPEDPLGVVEVAPGEPIVMGYALVTSGPNSNLGIDSMRGVEIALDDLGNMLLGHDLQLEGEDSGCSTDGGQAAASRLITNQQIVGIVGPTCSSAGNVMAPVIDEAGMVMISPSNTAPGLTDPATHVEGFLRTAHNDTVQGALAAEFAYNELGLTSAATIHDGSIYADQLVNVFAERFEELGGTVVAQESVNTTDTDMQPVLTRIALESPQIIYYPIFMPAGGFVTRQASEVAGLEEVVLMGADGLFNPDFIEAAGESVVGMYLSNPDLTSLGAAYQEFLEKHQTKYNEPPLSTYHANAYDATMLIINAAKRVAKRGEDGTLYIPRQALRDALYATENYQGLTGNLTCNENGDCADPYIAVFEIASADLETWSPGSTGPDANPRKVYP